MSLPVNNKKTYQRPRLVSQKIEIGVFGTYNDADCGGGGYTGQGGFGGHGGHGGHHHGGHGW